MWPFKKKAKAERVPVQKGVDSPCVAGEEIEAPTKTIEEILAEIRDEIRRSELSWVRKKQKPRFRVRNGKMLPYGTTAYMTSDGIIHKVFKSDYVASWNWHGDFFAVAYTTDDIEELLND